MKAPDRRGRDLMQIAAAVVGTAAASQAVEPVGAELAEDIERGFWRIATDAGVTVADVRESTLNITGHAPGWGQVRHVLRGMIVAGRATVREYADRFFPVWPDLEPAPLGPEPASVVHYVVRGNGVTSCCGRPPLELPVTDRLTDGTDRVPDEVDCPGLHTYESQRGPGVHAGPNELSVIGTNGRRLIVRWSPEGVWVGGCLITEPEHADALAAFITRESDE